MEAITAILGWLQGLQLRLLLVCKTVWTVTLQGIKAQQLGIDGDSGTQLCKRRYRFCLEETGRFR